MSASGYYEWRVRGPSLRALADQAPPAQIREIQESGDYLTVRATKSDFRKIQDGGIQITNTFVTYVSTSRE